MSNIKCDWSWSDRFIPAIKQAVGPYLLATAPLEVDRHEATDLIVLRNTGQSIAARVRRGNYWQRFQHQITIRVKRDSGSRTEFRKIAEGFGDLFFYAFASPGDDPSFASWKLIDLKAFRGHLILNCEQIKTGEQDNGDGTYFRWFDLRSFPDSPKLVIASHGEQVPDSQ